LSHNQVSILAVNVSGKKYQLNGSSAEKHRLSCHSGCSR